MKRILLIAALAIFSLTGSIAQENEEGRKVPSVEIKDLDGNKVNTSDFNNDGKPMIINFWATWCAPCKRELNTIHEVYEDWVDETGVKIIAVSIDDARSSTRVKPMVNSSGWEYEIYLDENSDFKRAMNVQNPPFTFLVDGDGNIVYTHTGFAAGDEEELYEKVLELVETNE